MKYIYDNLAEIIELLVGQTVKKVDGKTPFYLDDIGVVYVKGKWKLFSYKADSPTILTVEMFDPDFPDGVEPYGDGAPMEVTVENVINENSGHGHMREATTYDPGVVSLFTIDNMIDSKLGGISADDRYSVGGTTPVTLSDKSLVFKYRTPNDVLNKTKEYNGEFSIDLSSIIPNYEVLTNNDEDTVNKIKDNMSTPFVLSGDTIKAFTDSLYNLRLSSIENDHTQLTSSVANVDEKVQTTINNLAAEKGKLDNYISSNNSKVNTLTGTVNNNTVDISSLKSKDSSLESSINGLNERLNSKISELNTVKDDINTMKGNALHYVTDTQLGNYYNKSEVDNKFNTLIPSDLDTKLTKSIKGVKLNENTLEFYNNEQNTGDKLFSIDLSKFVDTFEMSTDGFKNVAFRANKLVFTRENDQIIEVDLSSLNNNVEVNPATADVAGIISKNDIQTMINNSTQSLSSSITAVDGRVDNQVTSISDLQNRVQTNETTLRNFEDPHTNEHLSYLTKYLQAFVAMRTVGIPMEDDGRTSGSTSSYFDPAHVESYYNFLSSDQGMIVYDSKTPNYSSYINFEIARGVILFYKNLDKYTRDLIGLLIAAENDDPEHLGIANGILEMVQKDNSHYSGTFKLLDVYLTTVLERAMSTDDQPSNDGNDDLFREHVFDFMRDNDINYPGELIVRTIKDYIPKLIEKKIANLNITNVNNGKSESSNVRVIGYDDLFKPQ